MVDVAGAAHGRSITVNGTSLAVDSSGHFHTRVPAVPGVNLITAHLNGLLGGEAQRAFLYGDFVAPDALLAPLSAALQTIAPSIVSSMVRPIEVPLPRWARRRRWDWPRR